MLMYYDFYYSHNCIVGITLQVTSITLFLCHQLKHIRIYLASDATVDYNPPLPRGWVPSPSVSYSYICDPSDIV